MVAIAIDLGTTYTCVAVWRNGTVEVIANDQGNRTTPSYVAFTAMERLIGEPAKTQAPQNPRNTVYAVKRLIGRRYDDISIQLDLPFWPFQVIDENGKPKILVEYKGKKKTLTPEEISAMLLCRMKEVAEAYLGTKVEDAVITVPAYFNDAQRQATRIAGTIAGLKVLRIINEPTAAALAYGLDCNLKGDKNLLIYDLGGGTLDVSVLTIGDGSVYEVKATAGNSRLGGEDFDNRLVVFLAEDFKNKFGIDILRNSKSLRRLKTAAERTKRFLTSVTEAPVEVESLYTDIDYCGKVSRALFEDLCSDLFKDTLIPIERALKDAKMKKEDIHNVILIGGSTRIPKIQSMLQEYFKKPLTTSINPDEAVAYGAAIQAAILSGEHHKKIQDVLLVDVVPLSLGIETVTGLMLKVIERNTPIPCQQTKELTTLEDYQTAMTIEIFEGERTLTTDNNLLGRFDLKDIPPAPRGVPKIYVTFNVDSNGILSVSAQDQATGNTEGITINNDQRLNQKDILVMMADADRFKEEDNENKRRLEARNQLETYVYNTKNIIRENSNKITEEEKTFLQNECEEALNWLESNVNNVREEYEVKISELMRRWSKVLAKFCDLRHRVKRQKSEAQQAETSGQAQAIIQELEAIEDELGKNLDNK